MPNQGEISATIACDTSNEPASVMFELPDPVRTSSRFIASGRMKLLAVWNSTTQTTKASSRRSSTTRQPSDAALRAPRRGGGGSVSWRGGSASSARIAGTVESAASQNGAEAAICAPARPISTAPMPLPSAMNRVLRANRVAMAARPTRLSVTAATAGTSMQLATPCSTSAPITGTSEGNSASSTALPMTASSATSVAPRFQGLASIAAPAGIWQAIVTIEPTPSAMPIWAADHLLALR